MSLRKRMRVLWAALTQDWREKRCACGAVIWSQRQETEPFVCDACEAQAFEQWIARTGQKDVA